MSRPIVNATPNGRIPATVDWIKNSGAWSDPTHRWIGRCKTCHKTHRLEGQLLNSSRGAVIMTANGRLYMTGDGGSNYYKVLVPCEGHWCTLQRVTEGMKKSKHECGARCTNATGPNCDCRCKGKNHGSHC